MLLAKILFENKTQLCPKARLDIESLCGVNICLCHILYDPTGSVWNEKDKKLDEKCTWKLYILIDRRAASVFPKCGDERFFQVVHRSITGSIEEHYKAVDNALDVLKNIKFDVFSGKFYTNGDDKVENARNLAMSLKRKFEGDEHIQFGFEECCVCFDLTSTKTSCDHYLCVKCASNLKKKRSCPVCRGKLIVFRDEDDDEEEQEEDDD